MTKRALIDPFVVAPPKAVSARTRLFPSDSDETVLREIGDHLGNLLCSDLATRCRLGVGPKYLGRAKRKRVLTPHCSSRWAGAITRIQPYDRVHSRREGTHDLAGPMDPAETLLNTRERWPGAMRD